MIIQAPCVVGLVWFLRDAQNRPIDELTEPTEFFFGGDDLLPKVEEVLQGKAVGDEVDVHLEPEHAFGEYDTALVCFEPRALFPEATEPGMQFEGLPAGSTTPGMPSEAIYTVTEVYPEHVVLDGNHPLAGMALRLHIKVCSARPPSEEEAQARSLGHSEVSLAPPAHPLH